MDVRESTSCRMWCVCLRQEEGLTTSSRQEAGKGRAGKGGRGGLLHMHHQRSVSLVTLRSISVATGDWLD